MRSTLGIFALGLASSVVAHDHHNHQHFHERAAPAESSVCEVVTYTTTSTGEWGLVPETSSSSSAAPTTSSAAPTTSSSTPPPPPPPTTSSEAPPPPPTTTSYPSAPEVNYKAVVAPPPAAPTVEAPKPWGDAGFIAPNGNKWAFCYTPYTSGGDCKSADQVKSDLQGLKGKGFTTIRTYGTDCNTVSNVGAACHAAGLKMILGVPIDGSGVGGAYGQLDNLANWGKDNWSIVEMVVVGNEPIFAGFCSAGELVGLISAVKEKFKGAGYSGPVTTTDTLSVLQQYGDQICPVVDVVAANIHPYFNDAVSALLAGPFAAKQMIDLAAVCGHKKEAYCLETGWPSAGNANGIAIPGFDAQKIAITGIMAAIGGKAAVFSYEDDKWKNPGAYGVEQSWGCSGLF